MKPRTVILTLELQDCMVPLIELRRVNHAALTMGGVGNQANVVVYVDVAQATATVAQPSKPAKKKADKR